MTFICLECFNLNFVLKIVTALRNLFWKCKDTKHCTVRSVYLVFPVFYKATDKV